MLGAGAELLRPRLVAGGAGALITSTSGCFAGARLLPDRNFARASGCLDGGRFVADVFCLWCWFHLWW